MRLTRSEVEESGTGVNNTSGGRRDGGATVLHRLVNAPVERGGGGRSDGSAHFISHRLLALY